MWVSEMLYFEEREKSKSYAWEEKRCESEASKKRIRKVGGVNYEEKKKSVKDDKKTVHLGVNQRELSMFTPFLLYVYFSNEELCGE